MKQERVRYAIDKAIAWADEIKLALDEDRPLPLTMRVPGFEPSGSRRPEAFSHWTEYSIRALRRVTTANNWVEQFSFFRRQDTIEDEFICMRSVLRCAQRELNGISGKLLTKHLYAAEIFCYSFENYRNHLGGGNIRYEDLMPDDATILRQAVAEDWPLLRVAKAMEVDTDIAASLIQRTKKAIEVLEAPTPAASFRIAIRQLVQRASESGLKSDEEVEDLVEQICYRVSDLSCLLDINNATLSEYSQDLRRDSD